MKTLSVGIGCRLHSSAEQIEAAVCAALGALSFDEICTVASVDTKTDEAGLVEFCARYALPLKFFSREQIATIAISEPSATVREHLGVDGVCEPCAWLAASMDVAASRSADTPGSTHAADSLHAQFLVRKTIRDGVTVAIASTIARTERDLTHTDIQQQEQNLP